MSEQKALIRVLSGGAASAPGTTPGPLEAALAPFSPGGGAPAGNAASGPEARAALCGRWLDEAQEMLRYGVAPARVMEGFASRLFVLLRTGADKA